MTPEERQQMDLEYLWKCHWATFLRLFPEILEIPLKLDRDWLIGAMTRHAMRLMEVVADPVCPEDPQK